jgi:hypothetical protein
VSKNAIILVPERFISFKLAAAELRKEEHLKSVELLKRNLRKTGTKSDLKRITAFGYLIETTDFLNIPPDKKQMIKENMIWCNNCYADYVDTTK